MPRPPHHLSDLDLLTAVRAVLIENGRLKMGDGVELDPRFAELIRVPSPPAPLDLRATIPTELAAPVAEHLAGVTETIGRVIESVQEAALAAIDREQVAAVAMIEAADRRAGRAEQYVEALRREIAEALGDAERARASSVRERADLTLEIARLTGELAVQSARAGELDRRVADVNSRLNRAEVAAAAARSAEMDARSAAATPVAQFRAQAAAVGQPGRPVRKRRSGSDANAYCSLDFISV